MNKRLRKRDQVLVLVDDAAQIGALDPVDKRFDQHRDVLANRGPEDWLDAGFHTVAPVREVDRELLTRPANNQGLVQRIKNRQEQEHTL